jgi:hypothetical protein
MSDYSPALQAALDASSRTDEEMKANAVKMHEQCKVLNQEEHKFFESEYLFWWQFSRSLDAASREE